MTKENIIKEVFGDEGAITPNDLLSKEFKRGVGGYNTNDVDEFLEQVAEVMEKQLQQTRALKEEVEQQRTQLEEFREIETSLRKALLSSQKFGEDIIESAKREAALLLEEARLKNAQAQVEATKIPLNLSQDIALLQQQRNRLRVELTAILDTHRNLLDSLIPPDTLRRPGSVFEVSVPAPEAPPAPGLSEGLAALQEQEPPAVDVEVKESDHSETAPDAVAEETAHGEAAPAPSPPSDEEHGA